MKEGIDGGEEMRDAELLTLLKNDPNRGIRIMTELYSGLVYSVVRGRLSEKEFCVADIENCVADPFTDFYLSVESFDPRRGSIQARLCVIAKNNAINLLRKRKMEREILPLEVAENDLADDYTLEGDFSREETRRELLEAINALPDCDRKIIIRKFYLRQPSRLIAEEMGLTVSNVDVRTHRAIEKLRKRLKGEAE